MPKKIINIVGGGTAGWVSASILAKGLPNNTYTINLVESPDIKTVGVGEATIPPILALIDYLNLSEREFLGKVNGTYKYGINFEGWSKTEESYMHAFGELGTPYDGIAFSSVWLACAHALDSATFSQYSPNTVASFQGKFGHPVSIPENANPSYFYPLSKLHYAFQFDAGSLVELLREVSIDLGVKHIQDMVTDVTLSQSGDIESVSLKEKGPLIGDYFVDCSGMAGLLNKRTLKCNTIDCSDYLPCDRALAVQTENDGKPLPFTRSISMNSGWRWQIPLRHRNGNGYVYSSQFISDEEAKHELLTSLKGEKLLTEPKLLKFKTGYLATPWCQNSIAIGLSSGFFEPLESTSIHLIHKYAIEFKNALIYGQNMQQEANQFNHKFNQDAAAIKDFLIAHYHINQQNKKAFWTHCQNMPIPASLREKLEEFKQTGYIALPKDNLFHYNSWFQLLVGQNFLPNYDHFAQAQIETEQAKNFFYNVEQAIKHEVNKLPSHLSQIE